MFIALFLAVFAASALGFVAALYLPIAVGIVLLVFGGLVFLLGLLLKSGGRGSTGIGAGLEYWFGLYCLVGSVIFEVATSAGLLLR